MAVPPRNATRAESHGSLKMSHSARQMIRSCSTCRGSGHGVVALHSWTKALGITRRSRQAR